MTIQYIDCQLLTARLQLDNKFFNRRVNMATNVRMNSGTIEDTLGAAQNVACGFVPEFVMVYNLDATDGDNRLLLDFKDQADGDSVAIVMMDNDGGSDRVSIIEEGTNGLSAYKTNSVQTSDPVQITGGQGFTIPANFSDTGDTLYWVAWGHD